MKYEGSLLQRVGDAISVNNKLLDYGYARLLVIDLLCFALLAIIANH